MKTIQVSDSNWKYLQKLRIENNHSSINDILDIILTHTNEAIKRGNFKIFKKVKGGKREE